MTRLLLQPIVFCLVAPFLAAKETPLVVYTFMGGFSPYTKVKVVIEPSGHASVQTEKQRSAPVNYDTDLSKEELAALRALVQTSDFFSEPDKDTQFVTDAGQTELTVNESDRNRTLKFSYRPSLQPLTGFIWRIVTQAEAFAALQKGNLYDVMGAIVPSDSRGKALQPYKFKAPMMAYFYSSNDDRRMAEVMRILAPMTTVDEFTGLVASLIARSNEKPLYIPVPAPSKEHRLAACPLYLAYLKQHFSQPADYTQGNYGVAISMAAELADIRYEPAIPYFFQLFDAHNEGRVTGDLFPLSAMGSLTLVQLTGRLDSKNDSQRLVAIELLSRASRWSAKNAIPNPVSNEEFDKMRKIFNQIVLPKLAALAEKDGVAEVRQKATLSANQIKTELTKKDEITGPFVKLSVAPDHTLKRTRLEGEEHKTICWHVLRDGKEATQKFAEGDTEYTHPDRTPAVYTAYVSAWVQGEYRVVSNIVSFKIESSLRSSP